ncbi:MAG: hydrogen peroxide-inducible genes activator [Deltaproteobacteria bacterium]|nr:hydrogen peroxide-inducible genes activator [Deltaproteobacteria bacterium]
MTLTQIEYAIAVAKFLSFQKAAQACHVAQPSLSTQVKKLEDQLGVKLFQRSTNTGVTVTEVGLRAIEQMQVIVNEANRLEGICSDHNVQLSGVVRLGIVPTVSPYLIPLFWSAFRKQYPHVKLELHEEPTKRLMEGLRAGRVDITIMSPPKDAPDFVIEKLLYYEPFVLYASPDHPLLATTEVKSPVLAKHDLITIDEAHCMREQVLAACGKLDNPNDSGVLRNGGIPALISLVDAESSYTLIPKLAESILSPDQRRRGVRPVVAKTPYRRISIVYNRNQVRKRLMEALFQCIRSCKLPDSVSLSAPKGNVHEPSLDHFQQV